MAVQQHLILIKATIAVNGAVGYQYFDIMNGGPGNPPAGVGPGHLFAWYLQVVDARGATSYPPYRLTFANESFFGVSSLDVPHGGYSRYLNVSTISGGTKYLIIPATIPASPDPQIQIDTTTTENRILLHVMRSPDSYAIQWQAAAPNLVYSRNAGALQPFPASLTVHPADVVTFSAPANIGLFGVNFTVSGAPNPLQVTPFDGNQNPLSGSTNGTDPGTTGPNTVAVTAVNTAYQFCFETANPLPGNAVLNVQSATPKAAGKKKNE